MIDVGKWALDNKNLVKFIVVVFILGGIYSCYKMSKLEDPEIKVKTAMVITAYPGASAHQVELEVTDVLEKAINTIHQVSTIESYSYNDFSLIQVELETTVDDDNVEQCWDLLRRKVNDAGTQLPKGCSTSIVKDDFGNVLGMFYAITGDGLSERELSDYVELIKRELLLIDGVTRVEIYGKQNECINISLNQAQMANLGVMPAEVIATINGQNETVYAGYFDNGENRIRINVSDKFSNVNDIGDLIIQGHEDDQLRLSDIATIEKNIETPTRNKLLYNANDALGLLIATSPEFDVIKVGNAVESVLSELQKERLPIGVDINKVFIQPERVADALGNFAINLLESVAIVVLILMLTMGIKSGLIIGTSLLIIVLGSFLFLQLFDGTLQRVSLGTLILAMGMLVDNAIVIVDGILVDLKRGKSRMEALTAIGRQTAIPLLGATLIAIIAFLPIFLSPDTAGVYTRDLFIVLAVSLLLSWVLALTHVPLMANTWLKNNSIKTQSVEYDNRFYKWLRSGLKFGLRHRWGMIVTMIFLLLLSGLSFLFMKRGFFPDMVYDQLYMEYKLPEGTNSTKVEADLAEIQSYLKTRPEIKNITTSIGGTPGRYNLVRSIANPSLAYGELIIDFDSPKALVDNMGEIQNYLNENYPDAYVKLKRYNLMFKKYPIEAKFSGPDPAVLMQLADTARRIMENTTEVCLITQDMEPEIPVITIDYNQPTARASGLTRANVGLSLLASMGGIPISNYYDGIHKNTIYLKCLEDDNMPISDISNTQIFSTMPNVNGLFSEDLMLKLKAGTLTKNEIIERLSGTIPLQQVANNVEIGWEYPVIPRYNGQRCVRVQCSPIDGVSTENARVAVAEKIEQIKLPDGYSLEWIGEKYASTRSMKYLFDNFPLAVMLMVAILILLFKDYRKPIIIFCCLPLILIGVVIAMFVSGKTFDFVAIVGTLGLLGMLIKNGIVMMDEITLQIKNGVEPIKALIDSAQNRFRPVMMASLTTILGMIPLLGDAMFGSMAVAIMGGLFVGSIITLIFLPVLYAVFFKIKNV